MNKSHPGAYVDTANKLVLSLFPGIDLLGMAFKQAGFCVVSAGDIAFGHDIQDFHAPARHFSGVILGSPCQAWSVARRGQVTEEEKASARSLIGEGARVILEAAPNWWLWENVPSVPSIKIEGYTHQRFDLTHAECGGVMLRRRHFQFGVRMISNEIVENAWWNFHGSKLILPRVVTNGHLEKAPVGERSLKTPWRDLCAMFDLPENFELSGLSRRGKYLAVRNGVPLRIGKVIAAAIRNLIDGNQVAVKICACGCGRSITGQKQSLATPACRKRMERWRKNQEQETLTFSANDFRKAQ